MKRFHLYPISAMVVATFFISAIPAIADSRGVNENSNFTSGEQTKRVSSEGNRRDEIARQAKKACKNGAWKLSTVPVFVNQGDCVSNFTSNAAKAEAVSVVQSVIKAEVKAEANSEVKSEDVTQVITQVITQAKIERNSDTEVKSKSDADVDSGADSDVDSDGKSNEAKDACKDGGWKLSTALVFKNQGDCVSHFASEGKSDVKSEGKSEGKSDVKSEGKSDVKSEGKSEGKSKS